MAGYDIIHDAISDSLEGFGKMDVKQKEYLSNMLTERRDHNEFIASVSVINKDFYVVASSEEYQADELSQLRNMQKEDFIPDGSSVKTVPLRKRRRLFCNSPFQL